MTRDLWLPDCVAAAIAHRPPPAGVQPAAGVSSGRRNSLSGRLRDPPARRAGARHGAAGPSRRGGAWRPGPHTARRGGSDAVATRSARRRADPRLRCEGRPAGRLGARAGPRLFPSSRATRRPAVTPRRPAFANAFSTGSVRGWPACAGRSASLARSMLARSRATSSDGPPEPTPGPELRAALEGRYGADVRPTPGQRSLTLYSAVPIRHGDRVVGAAVVSQSTFRILQALYDVRLRIFEIVVASIAPPWSSGC